MRPWQRPQTPSCSAVGGRRQRRRTVLLPPAHPCRRSHQGSCCRASMPALQTRARPGRLSASSTAQRAARHRAAWRCTGARGCRPGRTASVVALPLSLTPAPTAACRAAFEGDVAELRRLLQGLSLRQKLQLDAQGNTVRARQQRGRAALPRELFAHCSRRQHPVPPPACPQALHVAVLARQYGALQALLDAGLPADAKNARLWNRERGQGDAGWRAAHPRSAGGSAHAQHALFPSLYSSHRRGGGPQGCHSHQDPVHVRPCRLLPRPPRPPLPEPADGCRGRPAALRPPACTPGPCRSWSLRRAPPRSRPCELQAPAGGCQGGEA